MMIGRLQELQGPIVVLTGAGISRESGLDTFRDAGGVWARVNLEDVATPEGYKRNPELVHSFYNARRATLGDDNILPNAAHIALADLESKWSAPVLVVTQNIDNLHERAGTKSLVHMHGELNKAICEFCHSVCPWHDALTTRDTCPQCDQAGYLRPYVVWFGEVPLEMERIERSIREAALFVSIGTSGNVYPAAGFVQLAKACGATTVELNLEPSEGAALFDEAIHGPASIIVPEFVEKLVGPAENRD